MNAAAPKKDDTKDTTKAVDPKVDSDKTPEADQIKQAAGSKTVTSTTEADKKIGEAALEKAATQDTDGDGEPGESEDQGESPNSDALGDEWDALYAHIDKTKENSISKTLLLRQIAQFKDQVTGLKDKA